MGEYDDEINSVLPAARDAATLQSQLNGIQVSYLLTGF